MPFDSHSTTDDEQSSFLEIIGEIDEIPDSFAARVLHQEQDGGPPVLDVLLALVKDKEKLAHLVENDSLRNVTPAATRRRVVDVHDQEDYHND